MMRLRCAILSLALLSATAGGASAGLITVVNPSFEAQSLGIRQFTTGTLTGWSSPGSQGAFRPSANEYPGIPGATTTPATGIPDGVNVAYSNGGTISQILGDVLSVGTYTLQVSIGNRADDHLTSYEVQLLAGGNVLAQDNNSLTVTPGTFATSTVTYTAMSTDALLGDALEIRLINPTDTGQVNFDNVRLNFGQAVPEPSSIILIGMGLCGLGLRASRRRRA